MNIIKQFKELSDAKEVKQIKNLSDAKGVKRYYFELWDKCANNELFCHIGKSGIKENTDVYLSYTIPELNSLPKISKLLHLYKGDDCCRIPIIFTKDPNKWTVPYYELPRNESKTRINFIKYIFNEIDKNIDTVDINLIYRLPIIINEIYSDIEYKHYIKRIAKWIYYKDGKDVSIFDDEDDNDECLFYHTNEPLINGTNNKDNKGEDDENEDIWDEDQKQKDNEDDDEEDEDEKDENSNDDENENEKDKKDENSNNSDEKDKKDKKEEQKQDEQKENFDYSQYLDKFLERVKRCLTGNIRVIAYDNTIYAYNASKAIILENVTIKGSMIMYYINRSELLQLIKNKPKRSSLNDAINATNHDLTYKNLVMNSIF